MKVVSQDNAGSIVARLLALIRAKADGSHTHDYLPLSGGTLTGELACTRDPVVVADTIPEDGEAPSANKYGRGVRFEDSARGRMGIVRALFDAAGRRCMELVAVRSVGGKDVFNELILGIDEGGGRTVSVSDAAAWRTALSAASSGHTHAAATQSAAGLMSAADKKKLDGVAAGATALTWQKVYPVGAVYISYVSTSPASLFGGTWVQITGRFLRMANDVNTGGSDTVTLTEAQMPTHSHTSQHATRDTGTDWIGAAGTSKVESGVTGTQGGGGSHSNMPAYQDLYAWRRTA